MKKILLIIMLCLAFTACNSKQQGFIGNNAVKEGEIGKDTPVKRFQVAKMLALSAYDINTIEAMERKIVFEDTDIDKPYDKYINAAFTAGLISGADRIHFEPEAYLSLEQAQFLLNKVDKTGALKLQYNHEDRKKPISCAMWTEVFERAMELNKNTGIISCNIITYATGENCSELGNRFIMTDRGLLSVECCEADNYNDCTVLALVRDKEVLALKSVANKEPSVMGAVVINSDDKGVTLDMGGIERYFYIDDINSVRVGDNISFKYSGNQITQIDNAGTVSQGVSISQ